MNSTTQQLIEKYYEYFNRNDMPSFLNLLDENVIHDINEGKFETGKDKFSAFLKHMAHCYKETIKNIIVMVSEDGKHAAAKFVVDGVYLATDKGLPEATQQHYELSAGSFFSVNDSGKISRVTVYYNLSDWLKQITG